MSEICRVLPQLERLRTRQCEALSYLMVRVKQAAISAQSVDNAATSEHAIGAQTSIIRMARPFARYQAPDGGTSRVATRRV
jgi:hypothetical protein